MYLWLGISQARLEKILPISECSLKTIEVYVDQYLDTIN